MNLDRLIETLREMPEPLIEQVQDFADFLQERYHVAGDAESQFWALIELIDNDAPSEREMLQPLIAALATKSEKEIFSFMKQRALKLRALDGPAYHDVSGMGHSADGFLYARCAVVAAGQDFYKSVLKDAALFPKDASLERLLTCAEEAYSKKYGKDPEYFSGIIYESFFNDELWGEGATQRMIGLTPADVLAKATAR